MPCFPNAVLHAATDAMRSLSPLCPSCPTQAADKEYLQPAEVLALQAALKPPACANSDDITEISDDEEESPREPLLHRLPGQQPFLVARQQLGGLLASSSSAQLQDPKSWPAEHSKLAFLTPAETELLCNMAMERPYEHDWQGDNLVDAGLSLLRRELCKPFETPRGRVIPVMAYSKAIGDVTSVTRDSLTRREARRARVEKEALEAAPLLVSVVHVNGNHWVAVAARHVTLPADEPGCAVGVAQPLPLLARKNSALSWARGHQLRPSFLRSVR